MCKAEPESPELLCGGVTLVGKLGESGREKMGEALFPEPPAKTTSWVVIFER